MVAIAPVAPNHRKKLQVIATEIQSECIQKYMYAQKKPVVS